MKKRVFHNIKSILHCNFHYYREPRDALYDECGLLNWQRVGNVLTAGEHIPYDVECSPKFGYRCLVSNSDSKVRANNSANVLNINSNGQYEFSLFFQIPDELDGWDFLDGHSYSRADEQMTFANASAYAQSKGAHLPYVHNDDQNRLIRNMLDDNTLAFLGLHKNSDESWNSISQWPDGSPLDYTNWRSGAPNDTENCSEIHCKSGDSVDRKWTTNNNEVIASVILEYDYDVRFIGNILNLDDMLSLSFVNGQLSLTSDAFGINSTSSGLNISTGTWQHLLLRIYHNQAYLFLNGTQILSAELSNATIQPDFIELGGFTGFLDEFVFTHDAGTGSPTVPTAPVKAALSPESVGGFGNGKDGDIIIDTNKILNSYALVNSVSGNTLSLSNWTNGEFLPRVNSEVMIHVTRRKDFNFYIQNRTNYENVNLNEKAGLYAFAHILDLDTVNNTITLDNCSFDDFTINSDLLNSYYVQVLTVPNFNSLNISESGTINPLSWSDSTGGGIVAFSVKNDCALQGKIISHGFGTPRGDLFQMTHSELIDRFLFSQGGGIFIATGGTFISTSGSRLGNDWSGSGTSHDGAAGFGGDGRRSNPNATNRYSSGGVGGGGGAGWAYGTDVGKDADNISSSGGGCGGEGGLSSDDDENDFTAGGGGQANSGGHGYNLQNIYDQADINGGNAFLGGGGGAPGGNGGVRFDGDTPTCAGACVILIAGRVCLHEETLSTGGEGGGQGYGGAGTGFAYIAAKEMV